MYKIFKKQPKKIPRTSNSRSTTELPDRRLIHKSSWLYHIPAMNKWNLNYKYN